MIARVLPPNEWNRLIDTEAGPLWSHFSPDTRVLVVEDAASIVGCWVLMPVWHAECLWIAPEHRGKSSVARRLWAFMRQTAKALGAKAVATAAISDDVRGLLAHVGAVKVEGDHYAMRMD